MNNKLFRAGEIVTIRANLQAIEKTLGEPIPGGIIDLSELKDHVLRPGEVLTICQNIRRIQGNNYHVNYNRNTNPTNLELILFFAIVGIGIVLALL